jgi:short-subunit dehydrogenase
MKQHVWLIGASDGIGASLARRLAKDGYTLALSARNAEKLQALSLELAGKGHLVIPLDVQKPASVMAAWALVKKSWNDTGGNQIFIYNAGAYEPMNAQTFIIESVETMIDVNLTGAFRMLACVLPEFLERNAGHIVIVGSVAGYRGLPNAIGYGASKAAINHLAENLKLDLSATKIKVQLVTPGFVQTRLTDKNDFPMPFLISSDSAANYIADGIRNDRFEICFPWQMALIFKILYILPNRLYFGLVKYFG